MDRHNGFCSFYLDIVTNCQQASAEIMKGASNVQDIWIEAAMRGWLFYVRCWFPLAMAVLPSPTEDKGLREAYNILRKRIDDHEKRLADKGL